MRRTHRRRQQKGPTGRRRSDFCASPATASREESQELRQLRQANQQLQRDLNRKDKALAEAAALLVLQKKYRALWAAEDV